ncbi:hypothetical protein D3C81_1240300 [compost metagenome]
MYVVEVGEELVSPHRRHLLRIVRVRQPFRLGDMRDGVEPEAVHALLEPPLDHVVQLADHGWIFPVQIGLMFGIQVQVIFASPFVVLPHRAAEIRLPVVWRSAVFSLPPDVIVPLGIVRGLT